jgi:hypothetical protein
VDLPRRTSARSGRIDSNNHLRIEYRDKTLDVAAAERCKEYIGQFSLPLQIGICAVFSSLDPPSCPAGELPGCDWRTSHDRTNFIKGESKHVMEHKRQPFGGSQPVKEDKDSHADSVSHNGFLLRIDAVPGSVAWARRTSG